jgi:hypothetical protein
MARAYSVFLLRKNVPAREALLQAIKGLKFKLDLDDGYAPFKTAGYLPCTLEGEDAGFDLRFKDIDPAHVTKLAAELGERDVEIAFKWSGDVREAASAFIVCAALANDFAALIYDFEAEVFIPADELIAKARKAVAGL